MLLTCIFEGLYYVSSAPNPEEPRASPLVPQSSHMDEQHAHRRMVLLFSISINDVAATAESRKRALPNV